MSEKHVHQTDSENEWLLLLVIFTAKLELVFGFCLFVFQYFNVETNFLENENLFQKTGVTFFS